MFIGTGARLLSSQILKESGKKLLGNLELQSGIPGPEILVTPLR
jgi:hypothetical protein